MAYRCAPAGVFCRALSCTTSFPELGFAVCHLRCRLFPEPLFSSLKSGNSPSVQTARIFTFTSQMLLIGNNLRLDGTPLRSGGVFYRALSCTTSFPELGFAVCHLRCRLFPKVVGVEALLVQALKGSLHVGLVLLVGNAEPLGGGVDDFNCGFLDFYQLVGCDVEVVFGFHFAPFFAEEVLETFFQVLEKVGFENPEIHGYGLVAAKFFLLFPFIKENALPFFANFGAFGDFGEVAAGIGLTYAARYGAKIAQGVL